MFSNAIRLVDLDDFLLPAQECIKPANLVRSSNNGHVEADINNGKLRAEALTGADKASTSGKYSKVKHHDSTLISDPSNLASLPRPNLIKLRDKSKRLKNRQADAGEIGDSGSFSHAKPSLGGEKPSSAEHILTKEVSSDAGASGLSRAQRTGLDRVVFDTQDESRDKNSRVGPFLDELPKGSSKLNTLEADETLGLAGRTGSDGNTSVDRRPPLTKNLEVAPSLYAANSNTDGKYSQDVRVGGLFKPKGHDLKRSIDKEVEKSPSDDAIMPTAVPAMVAEVSLFDCLACNGCVTSAETVFLQQQSVVEVLRNIASKPLSVVSVSPQSRTALASYFGIRASSVIRKLASFFKSLGVTYVLDTSLSEAIALLEAEDEFLMRYLQDCEVIGIASENFISAISATTVNSSSARNVKQPTKTGVSYFRDSLDDLTSRKAQDAIFVPTAGGTPLGQHEASSTVNGNASLSKQKDTSEELRQEAGAKGSLVNFTLDRTSRIAGRLDFRRCSTPPKRSVSSNLPLVTSHCPGWICYAEKVLDPSIIGLISNVRSSQQIQGLLVKSLLRRTHNRRQSLLLYRLLYGWRSSFNLYGNLINISNPLYSPAPYDVVFRAYYNFSRQKPSLKRVLSLMNGSVKYDSNHLEDEIYLTHVFDVEDSNTIDEKLVDAVGSILRDVRLPEFDDILVGFEASVAARRDKFMGMQSSQHEIATSFSHGDKGAPPYLKPYEAPLACDSKKEINAFSFLSAASPLNKDLSAHEDALLATALRNAMTNYFSFQKWSCITAADTYHVCIMPCYDKKLEAARPNLVHPFSDESVEIPNLPENHFMKKGKTDDLEVSQTEDNCMKHNAADDVVFDGLVKVASKDTIIPPKQFEIVEPSKGSTDGEPWLSLSKAKPSSEKIFNPQVVPPCGAQNSESDGKNISNSSHLECTNKPINGSSTLGQDATLHTATHIRSKAHSRNTAQEAGVDSANKSTASALTAPTSQANFSDDDRFNVGNTGHFTPLDTAARDVDTVLSTSELLDLFKLFNVKFEDLEEADADSFYSPDVLNCLINFTKPSREDLDCKSTRIYDTRSFVSKTQNSDSSNHSGCFARSGRTVAENGKAAAFGGSRQYNSAVETSSLNNYHNVDQESFGTEDEDAVPYKQPCMEKTIRKEDKKFLQSQHTQETRDIHQLGKSTEKDSVKISGNFSDCVLHTDMAVESSSCHEEDVSNNIAVLGCKYDLASFLHLANLGYNGKVARVASNHGGSGGYLESVFRCAARKIYNIEIEGPLKYKYGKNTDYKEVTLDIDGVTALRFIASYGFRNIQNVMKQLKYGSKPPSRAAITVNENPPIQSSAYSRNPKEEKSRVSFPPLEDAVANKIATDSSNSSSKDGFQHFKLPPGYLLTNKKFIKWLASKKGAQLLFEAKNETTQLRLDQILNHPDVQVYIRPKSASNASHFIELMACPGGCLGGAGQAFAFSNDRKQSAGKTFDSVEKAANEATAPTDEGRSLSRDTAIPPDLSQKVSGGSLFGWISSRLRRSLFKSFDSASGNHENHELKEASINSKDSVKLAVEKPSSSSSNGPSAGSPSSESVKSSISKLQRQKVALENMELLYHSESETEFILPDEFPFLEDIYSFLKFSEGNMIPGDSQVSPLETAGVAFSNSGFPPDDMKSFPHAKAASSTQYIGGQDVLEGDISPPDLFNFMNSSKNDFNVSPPSSSHETCPSLQPAKTSVPPLYIPSSTQQEFGYVFTSAPPPPTTHQKNAFLSPQAWRPKTTEATSLSSTIISGDMSGSVNSNSSLELQGQNLTLSSSAANEEAVSSSAQGVDASSVEAVKSPVHQSLSHIVNCGHEMGGILPSNHNHEGQRIVNEKRIFVGQVASLLTTYTSLQDNNANNAVPRSALKW